jgi:3-hydroxyisobutyrate dehydrogenase-like beta-hydroxyacid dehydrogenase
MKLGFVGLGYMGTPMAANLLAAGHPYGGLIADERYQPAGFKAELGYKDMTLALSTAQELEVPMPLASLIADRFRTLIEAGGKDFDWSALGLLAKRDSGLATPLEPANRD